MRFTNKLVALGVMGIVTLSSCSSLPVFDNAEQDLTRSKEQQLTPLQTKVQALQAMANLYKDQAADREVSVATSKQFEQALQLKQQGDYAQARSRFITLSQQAPSLSGVWLQLALLADEQANLDPQHKQTEKVRYLNNAIQANPQNYLAHNEYALTLRRQGQFEQALEHYQLALASWPAFAEGYFNRGILYDLYMGEKALALADYELYQALTKDDSRQLKGWLIDLQRQIKSTQAVTQQAGAL